MTPGGCWVCIKQPVPMKTTCRLYKPGVKFARDGRNLSINKFNFVNQNNDDT